MREYCRSNSKKIRSRLYYLYTVCQHITQQVFLKIRSVVIHSHLIHDIMPNNINPNNQVRMRHNPEFDIITNATYYNAAHYLTYAAHYLTHVAYYLTHMAHYPTHAAHYLTHAAHYLAQKGQDKQTTQPNQIRITHTHTSMS